MLGVLVLATAVSMAPGDFPAGESVRIPSGMTLSEAADELENRNVIKSAFVYKAYAVIFGKGKIVSGEYLFDEPQSALTVSLRTAFGRYGLPRIKVTIPEGTDSRDMAWILLRNLPGFDAPKFVALAREKEGFLFPDTYYFFANSSPEHVISTMEATFKKRLSDLESDIELSGRKLDDVIIMASIVEREATTSEDRRIVAGILWKRLDDGMPLQVDAPFWYLFRKGTSELSSDDLRISSPYNTYKYKGLPPGPIASPGLEAIRDTINPKETKYWYYLSDKDGNMHYAATLEEHAANKRKYL